MADSERAKKNKDILTQYGVMTDRANELEKELKVSEEPRLRELFKIEKGILEEKLIRIEKAIMNLENVNERRVLWLCYIGELEGGKRKRLLLWQVANEMHYCYDWVKEKHQNGLKNLKFD